MSQAIWGKLMQQDSAQCEPPHSVENIEARSRRLGLWLHERPLPLKMIPHSNS